MALNRRTVKDVFAKVEAHLGAGRFEEAAKTLGGLVATAGKAGEKKDLPDLLVMLGQIQSRFEAGATLARATFDRAVALKEETGGADNEELFSIVTDAYAALRSSGRPEEALPFIERAAALWEKANGTDANRELVIILDNLASTHLLAKHLERAEEIFLKAIALASALEATEGPSLLAQIHVNRLEVLLQPVPVGSGQKDRLDEAEAVLAALEPRSAKLDPPVLAQVHYRTGQIAERRKDPKKAKESLLRGIAILEKLPPEQAGVFLRAQVQLLARIEEQRSGAENRD